jgi:hypothetical protein
MDGKYKCLCSAVYKDAPHLHGLFKSGKSNPAVFNVKYSVVAGHEDYP